MDANNHDRATPRGPVIVIATETRLFRDILGTALMSLRPGYEIVIVEPEHLGLASVRHRPLVVIASELPEAIEVRAPIWILLDPARPGWHVVSIYGRRVTTNYLDFDTIVDILDHHLDVRGPARFRRLDASSSPADVPD